jgi:uncharacterized protein
MEFTYWFMFPISILIATIAMASGVGGATFFAPIFILGLGLPPEIAIGTGLITEVFGFGSGLLAYYRKKLIDYKLGVSLLMATIPLALIGTWLSNQIEPDILKTILGVGLFTIALSFLRSPSHDDVAHADTLIEAEMKDEKPDTCLTTAEGEEICYSVRNRNEGRIIAGIGGLFVGLISTGLGELNSYFLLQRCHVPSRVSVATSVFVVAVTALVASTGHFIQFAQAGSETLRTVFNLCLFTVPGVIIGGQLGSHVAGLISQRTMERSIGILFILIALVTLGEVIL